MDINDIIFLMGKEDIEDFTEKIDIIATSIDLIRIEEGSVHGGRFKILEFLGEGGMGRVYKAFDLNLKEEVAIKIVKKKGMSEKDLERVFREVKIARNISHPNLVKYYDIHQIGDFILISLELIKGRTLKDNLKEKKFSEKEIKEIIKQIMAALDVLHREGIIHRDVKPENIFITEEGKIKLGDLGIVYLAGEESLTKTGEAVGTLAYMAPEQFASKEPTEKIDYYSLGILIYEMSKGEVPFKGTQAEIMKGHLHNPPPEIKKKETSKRLKKLINGLLIKDPKKRWGKEEVEKFFLGKSLPLLPAQKRFLFLSLIFIGIVFLIQGLIIPEIKERKEINLTYRDKHFKVSSKKKVLWERQMEYEINTADYIDFRKKGKKEVAVCFNYFNTDFEREIDLKSIPFVNIYDLRGNLIFQFLYSSINHFVESDFNLNYGTYINQMKNFVNGKEEKPSYYIQVNHYPLYPSWINYFTFKKNYLGIPFVSILNLGYFVSVCRWDDKIVYFAHSNTFLHLSCIGILPIDVSAENGDIQNYGINHLSIYLLKSQSTHEGNFSLQGDKLLFETTDKDLKVLIEKDGRLEGQRQGTPQKTIEFMKKYQEIKLNIFNGELSKAEEEVEKCIEEAKYFELPGYILNFINLKGEILFKKGRTEEAIKLCKNYAKNYPEYGIDLGVKAGHLAYLKGDYGLAEEIYKEFIENKTHRFLEVSLFKNYASILKGDYEKAEEGISALLSVLSQFWKDCANFQNGWIELFKKNPKEASKIFKKALEMPAVEEFALGYFLSKYIEGEPDLRGLGIYKKQYFNLPPQIKFAEAITKGDLEEAKRVLKNIEIESIHKEPLSILYPLIKKVIETYPQKFPF